MIGSILALLVQIGPFIIKVLNHFFDKDIERKKKKREKLGELKNVDKKNLRGITSKLSEFNRL